MDAQLNRKSLAGIPYYNAAININTADLPQILDAASALTRAVGRTTIKLGAAAVGAAIVTSILEAMFHKHQPGPPVPEFVDSDEPYIPIGCSPIKVRTGSRNVWGVILDEAVSFNCDQQDLVVPFHLVRKIEMASYCISCGTRACRDFCDYRYQRVTLMSIQTVDGSTYTHVRYNEPETLHLATIAGIQTVELGPYPWKTVEPRLFTADQVKEHWPTAFRGYASFRPALVSDVEWLRDRLRFVLQHKSPAITELIGLDILKTYFRLDALK